MRQAVVDATALAAPNAEGRFVLDTDASAVVIAGILHQEQEYNGKTILRPIVYGSKSLTRTQLNYEAQNLEMYAFNQQISFVPCRPGVHAARG